MLKILVLEDNEDRQDFVLQLYAAHEVLAVDSAAAAIEHLGSCEFNVVQLDYDVRGSLTGASVARYIRENHLHPLTAIHSDNPVGREEILEILPDAIAVPISVLRGRSILTNRLKALLSDSSLESSEPIRKLLLSKL